MKERLSIIIMIVLIIAILVMESAVTAYAFTAQTKGSVIDKYWSNHIKHDIVMVDREIITIKDSEIRTDVGDDVLINVVIDGPNRPVITIIYRIVDMDSPPQSFHPSETEMEENPPFWYER